MTNKELIEGIKIKKKRALAKAISLTENKDKRSFEIIKALYPHTGNAQYIGITGNPGAGKSTLINSLIKAYLEKNCSVAVLAVDPSSPVTGGAILGDRIRIDDSLLQEKVFFRSISNRNHLGGISATTFESMLLLDAYGFDIIIIETVGTGQSETLISKLADTNIVVTVPGLGDDIQAEKAGLLEIADIFVVNKADKYGAQRVKKDLEEMLSMHAEHDQKWTVPVLMTQATKDEGITELVQMIEVHSSHFKKYPKLESYEYLIRQKTKEIIVQSFEAQLENTLALVMDEIKCMRLKEKSHIEIAEDYANKILKSLSWK
jgi:LAO/AO transport system kinase